MDKLRAAAAVKSGKLLSKLFEIDLTIKICGVTIFSYHYPPKTDDYVSE